MFHGVWNVFDEKKILAEMFRGFWNVVVRKTSSILDLILISLTQ